MKNQSPVARKPRPSATDPQRWPSSAPMGKRRQLMKNPATEESSSKPLSAEVQTPSVAPASVDHGPQTTQGEEDVFRELCKMVETLGRPPTFISAEGKGARSLDR